MGIPLDLAKLVQILQTLHSDASNATMSQVKTRTEKSAIAAVDVTAAAGATAAAGTAPPAPDKLKVHNSSQASKVPASSTTSVSASGTASVATASTSSASAASTVSTHNKNAKDNAEKTRLHELVKTGKLTVVAKYLAKPPAGFDINAVDNDGHNALWHAALALDEPMAHLLLEKGITVIQNLDTALNRENFETDTALKALLLIQAELNETPSKVTEEVISTHTRLFSTFQRHCRLETKKFSKGKNCHLNKDGRFIVKPLRVQDIATLEKDLVKLKGGVIAFDSTGKENLIAYKGQLVRDVKKNYIRPPLFFVEAHDDYSVREFIIRNFDFFERMGYSRLCVEYDYNIDLETQLIQLSQFFNDKELRKERSKGDIQDLSNRFRFLSEVTKQSHWLTYEGIDLALEGTGLRFENRKKLTESEQMFQLRDEAMAKRIMQATDTAQGGTITLVGLRHLGILDYLVRDAGESAFQFQTYYCYTSSMTDLHNQDRRETLACFESYHARPEFNLTKFDLASANGIAQIYYTFRMKVASAALSMNPDGMLNVARSWKPKHVRFMQTEEELSQGITLLNKLLGLSFIIGIDNNARADALLYFKDYDQKTFLELVERIEAHIRLVKPLQFYSCQDSSKDKFVLVIPGINQENRLAIEEAVLPKNKVKPKSKN